ncbi:MAG: hypothetical protein KIS91_16170 [Anaerolineae bacterium]|nr:hypothetical protein [Anaerolineae bacterium]
MSDAMQERMQILKMIEDGKITPYEGAKLLEALKGATRAQGTTTAIVGGPGAGQGKWLCIRVTDMRSGRRKVNVNVPMSLVGIGAKIGAKFAAPVNVDLDEILNAIKSGQQGKIIDVQDDEDGERVEIFVE